MSSYQNSTVIVFTREDIESTLEGLVDGPTEEQIELACLWLKENFDCSQTFASIETQLKHNREDWE